MTLMPTAIQPILHQGKHSYVNRFKSWENGTDSHKMFIVITNRRTGMEYEINDIEPGDISRRLFHVLKNN